MELQEVYTGMEKGCDESVRREAVEGTNDVIKGTKKQQIMRFEVLMKDGARMRATRQRT